MAADERRLLDRLILQARMADEEPEDPTPTTSGGWKRRSGRPGFWTGGTGGTALTAGLVRTPSSGAASMPPSPPTSGWFGT